MKKKILIIFMLLMSLISMHAANLTSPPISIVPRPAQVVPGEGNFTFSSQTLFSVENHEHRPQLYKLIEEKLGDHPTVGNRWQ